MKSDKQILTSCLNTLDSVEIDYYNYNKSIKERFSFQSIGKIVIIKRMLAELLDKKLNLYLLPGESCIESDDDKNDWIRFVQPIQDEITAAQKNFILKELLPIFDGLGGIQDADDACLRCAKRMLAEVADYPELSHYRLMMEKEITQKYNTLPAKSISKTVIL